MVDGAVGQAPILHPLMVPKNLKDGSKYSILCAVEDGVGPYTFDWWFNEQKLVLSRGMSIKNDDESSKLLMDSIGLEHSGHYQCTVGTALGNAKAEIDLDVKGELGSDLN